MEYTPEMLDKERKEERDRILKYIAFILEREKRKYVSEPAKYKNSDANVWREGFNRAIDKVYAILEVLK